MSFSFGEVLGSGRLISLIGGGGKTSLMFALAREALTEGRTVITTTTTKIRKPAPEVAPTLLVGVDPAQAMGELRDLLRQRKHVTLARELPLGEKLIGIAPELVDEVGGEGFADLILVEADGSDGRSLKAHADHEPVIPSSSDLVIVVIGIDCIGARLDDRAVHRAALFSEGLGRPIGSRITVDDVAAIVHHPEGYLAKVPETARVVVLLNKVEDSRSEGEALRCAKALYLADSDRRLDRVVMGALQGISPWLRVLEPKFSNTR